MYKNENITNTHCPCGSGNHYLSCCGVYIEQQQLPKTPEQLMRSRYSAYTLANIDYIIKTMQAPAANNFDPVSAKKWAEQVEWLKLEVVSSYFDSHNPTVGFVEFKAYYRLNQQPQCLHELSEFHLQNGQWYYFDGQTPANKAQQAKMSRNDPCVCGSGKKYKKCCGQ